MSRAAAKTDGDVEDIVAMLSLAEEVVLESPATDGLLAGLQGRFLLSINDCPEIRETFSGFRIRETSTLYSCAREANSEAAELLVMNYEPDAGLLGFCGE